VLTVGVRDVCVINAHMAWGQSHEGMILHSFVKRVVICVVVYLRCVRETNLRFRTAEMLCRRRQSASGCESCQTRSVSTRTSWTNGMSEAPPRLLRGGSTKRMRRTPSSRMMSGAYEDSDVSRGFWIVSPIVLSLVPAEGSRVTSGYGCQQVNRLLVSVAALVSYRCMHIRARQSCLCVMFASNEMRMASRSLHRCSCTQSGASSCGRSRAFYWLGAARRAARVVTRKRPMLSVHRV
jgi:hypothetical protein